MLDEGNSLPVKGVSIDGGQIHPVAYEDTDSYQITKMFIENKDQLLKKLLEE